VRVLAVTSSHAHLFSSSPHTLQVLGGRHLKYGVSPDLAMFSKTMSNGFAMGAVIGRKEVMEVL
jgi:glutamate-1-semialdehyde aminotransferase